MAATELENQERCNNRVQFSEMDTGAFQIKNVAYVEPKTGGSSCAGAL
jgi:hypothetical protein